MITFPGPTIAGLSDEQEKTNVSPLTGQDICHLGMKESDDKARRIKQ